MIVTVVHRDRLYVPEHAVDMRMLRQLMEVPYQTKAHCSPGCPLATKQGRFCSTCPGREASVKLWARVETAGGLRLIALAGGSLRVLDRVVVGRYRVVDRRADPAFRHDLRWTGRLRAGEMVRGYQAADQRGMLRAWRARVHDGESGGVISAPPRTGKCVLEDSLVRTDQGYHRIARLVRGRDPDAHVEEIGRFGQIQAPGGVRDIRGIHAQTVDHVLVVELTDGGSIGGPPAHRIRVHDPRTGGSAHYRRLDQLTGHELVCRGLDEDDPVPPGRGLTTEAAIALGTVLRAADFSRLCTGVLSVQRLDDDLRLALACLAVTVRHDHVMMAMERSPFLANWPERLMASRRDAWRAFAEVLLEENDQGDPVAVLPDRDVARALHAHLTGGGVPTAIAHDGPRHAITVMDVDAWDQYLDGIPNEALLVPIHEVRRVMAPHRVVDVMIPEGHQYHANGVESHNTVLGVAGVVSERSRAFITASKIDFLRQFGRRFGELTNLRELYARGRRPVVLIDPRGWPDGPRYGVHVLKRWSPEVHRADVVMSVYHQFLNTTNGNRRRRDYLEGRFGTIVGDEIHQAGASLFSRLLTRLDARRKLGLTATLKRRDRLERVVTHIMGPVVAKGNSASTLPFVELMETGIGSSRDYRNWNAMTSYLVNMRERNVMLVRRVFADLRENPRNSVLITTTRRQHILDLVRMINGQAAYCRENRNEQWPLELAMPYYGRTDTNAVLNAASAGRVRVVVAMVSMSQLGLDVPRWTHVYIGVVPTSNPYNTYQLINRVCTPYPPEVEARLGVKPRATARILIDSLSASVFCFARLFKDPDFGLRAGLTDANYVGAPLYRMEPDVLARCAEIAGAPRSYSVEDAGGTLTLGRTRTGKRRRKSAWRGRGGVTSL